MLVGLVGATAYGVLRRPARQRIAAALPARIAALLALAAIPWLGIWVASHSHVSVNVSVNGVVSLVLWLAAALLVFALLVLLPLVALLTLVVWFVARQRRPAP
jgi:hypothetical protein